MAEKRGAGEGNRTLVVSLGSLGRRGKSEDFRHMPRSQNDEHPVNETGFSQGFTASLPQPEPRLDGVSIGKPQHTPGPWFANGNEIYARVAGEDQLAQIVARFAGNNDEALANAALGAAALEMVAARESLFDAIRHGDDAHQAWLRDAIDAHFAAADAKARGEVGQ